MIANGLFHRDLNRPLFWEQSARLVAGPRIWDDFRARGGRVGMLFWQQSLGESVDLVLSPAPIHKHHGGMIEDCYAQPTALYQSLCDKLSRHFKLRQYWGPLASAKVGEWIADATIAVLRGGAGQTPELLFTYLPSLDYDLQRFGPAHDKSRKALSSTLGQIGRMIEAARQAHYDVLVFGDYAITGVSHAVYPNRALREAGLMSVRDVRGRLYADLHTSRAFAVVDHEIAHVYVRDERDLEAARKTLAAVCGVEEILDRQARAARGLHHANSGELVIVAEPGCWFAYPWWSNKREQPDYASHVDIHNKPGYDPCELYFGWPPPSVSQDTSRIHGSHGRTGPGREIAWTSTLPMGEPNTLLGLAAGIKSCLDDR